MKTDHILVTVAGPDHPGITTKLMAIIHESGDSLQDMGQAVTHGLLSLSFLIEIKNRQDGDAPVLKELIFQATKMNLNLTYQEIEKKGDLPISDDEKFILNCVAPDKIYAGFIRDISSCLADYNINIQRIDNVRPTNFKALEITTTVPKNLNYNLLKEKLLKISTEHSVDVAFLKDNVFRRSKRLIVFDMDSTLIQTEVIDEMADVMGVGDNVRAITERAMNGEMDFDESLKQRVSQLKGLKVTQMQEILERLPFTKGAEEFVKTVKISCK